MSEEKSVSTGSLFHTFPYVDESSTYGINSMNDDTLTGKVCANSATI